jgi:hypothetical protein
MGMEFQGGKKAPQKRIYTKDKEGAGVTENEPTRRAEAVEMARGIRGREELFFVRETKFGVPGC